MVDTLQLPPGFKADARVGLLVVAILGEVLQGGLFFGWNALSIMIVDQGNFEEGCEQPDNTTEVSTDQNIEPICKSQESKLALLWTLGIFALNFGPVLMGFVLDYLGPKFTSILGVVLNILGLTLFGVSSSSGFNAFIPAAIILGLGNITFHLAQFHISALFPTKRGLISSVFVAGFTGSGIMMYLLQLIYEASGSTKGAYIGVLVGFAGILALWVPMLAWMMPNDSFKVGNVYLLRNDWKFEIRLRGDLNRTYRRTTALQDYVAAASAARERGDNMSLTSLPGDGRNGLMNGLPTSSDPVWSSVEDQRRERQLQQQKQWERGVARTEDSTVTEGPVNMDQPGRIDYQPGSMESETIGQQTHVEATMNLEEGNLGEDHSTEAEANNGVPSTRVDGANIGHESMPLPPDVSYGPLIFEARRFVELRKKTFKEQFLSTESFGMGLFYTLNVFFQQFYLGTQRLQLEHKGDDDHAYALFGNVIVAFAFTTIPIIGWLLDKKGYGWTLGAINVLSILTSIFQALPVLWIQSVTLIIWMVARFFMYSSYFAIFGALFGFRNFGKLVAIDNTFNGLFGLLQFPLTYLAIHALNGNFTAINIAQVVVLLPLMIFCVMMYRWEREDLVPIRPLEGEELPCDMMGARTRKSLPHVHLPHIEMPNLLHRQSREPGESML